MEAYQDASHADVADRFVRLDAVPTIQAANWWFQYYRRTGDQRALQCAIACRDMAVERKRTVRSTPTSSGLKARAVFAAGLACAVKVVVEACTAATAASTVQSRITPKVSHSGRYVLSGLVSIGALILLFVGSFSDSGSIMRELPSTSAVAQAPVTQVDVAEARSAHANINGEADQIASIRPQTGDVAESGGDNNASGPTAAVVALLTVPVYPKALGMERASGHRWAQTHAYVTRSQNQGTWLFPPSPNQGGNN